jgi:hypothetical protein
MTGNRRDLYPIPIGAVEQLREASAVLAAAATSVGEPRTAPPQGSDPAGSGWDFGEPGCVAYCGHRFTLKGTARRLLERLAQGGGRPVRYEALKLACGNAGMDDGTLRTHVCHLRRHLVRHLGKSLPKDPIPNVDSAAFRLDVG